MISIRLTISRCVLFRHCSFLVDKLSGDGHDVVLDELLTDILQMFLRVEFANVASLELLLGEFSLFLDSLLVSVSQSDQLLESILVAFAFLSEILHLQGLSPNMLVKIHEHVLLQGSLAIVDANRVIVPVEAVDKSLYRRLVEVTQVGCALSRLLTEHQRLWVDESEGIDNDLAFDGLYGIDNDGDCAGCQLLEGLLGIDVDRGEPAAEARMGMVPADY